MTTQELARLMLIEACDFVEYYHPAELSYFRKKDSYIGPDPARFHPSVADKLILLKSMQSVADTIPENYRTERNARMFAKRTLIFYYYPEYESKP